MIVSGKGVFTLNAHEIISRLDARRTQIEQLLNFAMKKAAALPEEQRNPWWQLARDLQEEARLTRKQIALVLEGEENRSEAQDSNCEEGEGFDRVICYGIHR
jgi:hypothetical protein